MLEEIRSAVVGFLSGELTAQDLREAIARHTLGIALYGCRQQRELVGDLELALSEYESGHVGRDDFSRLLAGILFTDEG